MWSNETLPKTPKAPLGEMSVGAPMDRLATDIFGPLPLTERNNRYILVVTDLYTESHIFKELCKMLEVRKTRTTARNTKFNGKVERFNKTLVRMIRSYLKGQQREWDKYPDCLAAAYRSSVHETTGFTPNMLMLGREVKMPSDVMFSDVSDSQEPESFGSYVENIRDKMRKAHQVAQEHLKVKAKRQKDNYDAKSSFNHYCVGDMVFD